MQQPVEILPGPRNEVTGQQRLAAVGIGAFIVLVILGATIWAVIRGGSSKSDAAPCKVVRRFLEDVNAGNAEAARRHWCVEGDEVVFRVSTYTVTRDSFIDELVRSSSEAPADAADVDLVILADDGESAEVGGTAPSDNLVFVLKMCGDAGWKIHHTNPKL